MMRFGISPFLMLGAIAVALLACKKSGGGGEVQGATGKFTGTYAITSGQNPAGGASYSGDVAITQSDQSYVVAWTLVDGSGFRGLGVEDGNLLGVGWGADPMGVIVYRITGSDLDGRWTGPGMGGKLGTEKLAGAAALSGTYTIAEAHSPKTGGSYEGAVTITPAGPLHNVQWALESGESYSGVGLREGNYFVVGWGPGASVVVYTDGAGKLNGKWASPGGTGLGSEALAKK